MSIEEQIKRAVAEAVDERLEPMLRRVVRDAVKEANQPEYLTRQQAAEYANWSLRKLDYLRKSGALPYLKRGGRVLVETHELRRYLEEGKVS